MHSNRNSYIRVINESLKKDGFPSTACQIIDEKLKKEGIKTKGDFSQGWVLVCKKIPAADGNGLTTVYNYVDLSCEFLIKNEWLRSAETFPSSFEEPLLVVTRMNGKKSLISSSADGGFVAEWSDGFDDIILGDISTYPCLAAVKISTGGNSGYYALGYDGKVRLAASSLDDDLILERFAYVHANGFIAYSGENSEEIVTVNDDSKYARRDGGMQHDSERTAMLTGADFVYVDRNGNQHFPKDKVDY